MVKWLLSPSIVYGQLPAGNIPTNSFHSAASKMTLSTRVLSLCMLCRPSLGVHRGQHCSPQVMKSCKWEGNAFKSGSTDVNRRVDTLGLRSQVKLHCCSSVSQDYLSLFSRIDRETVTGYITSHLKHTSFFN